MAQTRDKVCGADIHKQFLIATILSKDGTRIQERFATNSDDLLKFRDWIIENGCCGVAVESTGSYWYPIYSVLEGKVEFVLANAYQIKHIPGKKTDMLDSEWIAELYLNNLIKPSRIFPRDYRDMRSLTRIREALIKVRTQLKNRVHRILDSCCIRLSSVLSDSFGKSGRYIVDELLKGKSVENYCLVRGVDACTACRDRDLSEEVNTSKTNITLPGTRNLSDLQKEPGDNEKGKSFIDNIFSWIHILLSIVLGG